MKTRGIWQELKSRLLYRVALVYLLSALALVQLAYLFYNTQQLPIWFVKVLIISLLAGFIMSLIFAWIYEYGPGRVQHEYKKQGVGKPISMQPDRQFIVMFFSDIENSTRLVVEHGEYYAEILRQHREMVRNEIARFEGKEIDTAGDGFFVSFRNPLNAVLCAAAIQESNHSMEWLEGVNLKIRIGIHAGYAMLTDSGLIGLEVHRASRICNAAFGDQILLSAETLKLIKGKIPPSYTTNPSGEYRLKDFDKPELLYELVIPGVSYSGVIMGKGRNFRFLAVIPFSNLSDDNSLDYFCDGIAEEMTVALNRLPEIRVLSRSMVFSLRNKHVDPREFGKRFGVEILVEGTVRKNNDLLRVTVEIVDTKTGANIWSGRFDKELKDVFSLQEEISESIANVLQIKMSPKTGKDEMHTKNVAAYEAYIKGRRLYYEYSRKKVVEALEMFRKAIELDFNYALAYAGLGDCYAYLYMYYQSNSENLEKANDASRRAIHLGPGLAEAYASRGLALSLNKRYPEAETAFEKSLERNPQLFDGWYHYGRMCFAQGKLDKAARLFEQANTVRPDDYQSILLAGQIYADLGLSKLAQIAREKGVKITENILKIDPENTRALYMYSNGLVMLGKSEKGLKKIKKALEIDPEDPMLLYNAGCIFSVLGMKDEAIDCLYKCVDGGLRQFEWFENDSNLDHVRRDPRFVSMLEHMRKAESDYLLTETP